jgi:4'-phosphopantetheinyl transferase
LPAGFIGVWSSTHAVGVDVEDVNMQIEVDSLSQMYFTGAEARTVREAGPARLQTFLRLWSLKEAALKSIGEGLPFGLDAFEFELNGHVRVVSAPADHGGLRCSSLFFSTAPISLLPWLRGSHSRFRSSRSL